MLLDNGDLGLFDFGATTSVILVASGSRASGSRAAGEPALPTVLGYPGIGIAAVLILRVVATVVRDGHN